MAFNFNFDLGSMLGGTIGAVGSLFGGSEAADNARELTEMNINAQREFAQNGVRWRVEDAKAAGIHPLYALGASTSSFSPVSGYTGDYGISEAAKSFGQGIDRAVQVGMTKQERAEARMRQEAIDAAQLADFERRGKESEANLRLIDSQIALNAANAKRALAAAAPSPAMPSPSSNRVIPGQGDAGNLDKPINSYGFLKDDRGTFTSVIPGQDYASVYEDKLGIEYWPFIKAAFRDLMAKYAGWDVDGYYWHGEDKGYRKEKPVRPPLSPSSPAANFLRRGGFRSH